MEIQNDRKAAIKKLKLLTYNSKSNLDSFRQKMEEAYSTVFLPNGVERTEYKYGNIDCDILSPEMYSSNRVMIYIHGGCFSGGSRKTYRAFCSSLATKCYCRVVIPEFRLSPAYPCPAAIEDIQAVFRSLFTEEQIQASLNTEKGTTPKLPEIIIAADGSGATIACALLYNLRERYRNCISHVVLFSPWLDLSPGSKIMSSKKISDEVLTLDVFKKSVTDYTYFENTKISSVSPLLADDEQLKGFPPVFIQMGSKEILLEDAKEFIARLRENGNTCELDIWKGMMFMFQMADEYLHESHLALDKVGKIVTQDSAGVESVEIENKPKLEHSLHSEA
ncbi:MAG: alpha/beta hydrolase fold domain-containing protein [Treponema sp.]|nr:alpha/beta hydrolase fold domain-containing protein [Treponema sp.]